MRKGGVGGNYVSHHHLNWFLFHFDTPSACGGELHFLKGALTLLQNIIAPGQVYLRTGKVKAGHESGKVLSGEI